MTLPTYLYSKALRSLHCITGIYSQEQMTLFSILYYRTKQSRRAVPMLRAGNAALYQDAHLVNCNPSLPHDRVCILCPIRKRLLQHPYLSGKYVQLGWDKISKSTVSFKWEHWQMSLSLQPLHRMQMECKHHLSGNKYSTVTHITHLHPLYLQCTFMLQGILAGQKDQKWSEQLNWPAQGWKADKSNRKVGHRLELAVLKGQTAVNI